MKVKIMCQSVNYSDILVFYVGYCVECQLAISSALGYSFRMEINNL